MKPTSSVLSISLGSLGSLALLAGCPSSSSSTNPDVLWLAPDMAETAVKLQDTEPPPF